jgi:hypothetical protein
VVSVNELDPPLGGDLYDSLVTDISRFAMSFRKSRDGASAT